MGKKPRGSIVRFLSNAFDVVFVMILCFATLFVTMFMKGWPAVSAYFDGNSKYSFHILTFLIAAGGLALYIFYLIRNSNKELQNMGNKLYREEPDKK